MNYFSFFFISIIKNRENIFSSIYDKKVIYLTSILKNHCSQLSFEVYNVCVAQKLQIL
jgi:REP element-mobilizing transposase RayT